MPIGLENSLTENPPCFGEIGEARSRQLLLEAVQNLSTGHLHWEFVKECGFRDSSMSWDVPQSTVNPIKMFCDSQAAISIAMLKTQCIMTEPNFIYEKVNGGIVHLSSIPTHLQIADVFTKALPPSQTLLPMLNTVTRGLHGGTHPCAGKG